MIQGGYSRNFHNLIRTITTLSPTTKPYAFLLQADTEILQRTAQVEIEEIPTPYPCNSGQTQWKRNGSCQGWIIGSNFRLKSSFWISDSARSRFETVPGLASIAVSSRQPVQRAVKTKSTTARQRKHNPITTTRNIKTKASRRNCRKG